MPEKEMSKLQSKQQGPWPDAAANHQRCRLFRKTYGMIPTGSYPSETGYLAGSGLIPWPEGVSRPAR